MERYLCSWVGRISTVKMTITKCNLQFNVVHMNLPIKFFTELEKKFHNSYGNTKDPKEPKES